VTGRPRAAPAQPARPALHALPDPDTPRPTPRLDALDPEQRAAVLCTNGPLLVIAGAGSDKTRVMTERTAHLIEQGIAHPGQILSITFTNKAAGEMRERLARRVGPELAGAVTLGTFHALCARILRAHPRLGPLRALLDLRRGRPEARARALPDPRRQGADRARPGARDDLARQEPPRRARPLHGRQPRRARRACPARRHQADHRRRLEPGRRRARALRRAGFRSANVARYVPRIGDAALSPDGRTLAVTRPPGHDLEIRNVPSLRLRATLPDSESVWDLVSFTSDGRFLVGGSLEGVGAAVVHQDLEAGRRQVRRARRTRGIGVGQPGWPHARQRRSRRDDPPLGRARPTAARRPAARPAESPGHPTVHARRQLRLAIYGTGGRAYRWDVRPASWARHACTVAGRPLTRSEWRDALPERDYAPACAR
jgi:hypothetical protein